MIEAQQAGEDSKVSLPQQWYEAYKDANEKYPQHAFLIVCLLAKAMMTDLGNDPVATLERLYQAKYSPDQLQDLIQTVNTKIHPSQSVRPVQPAEIERALDSAQYLTLIFLATFIDVSEYMSPLHKVHNARDHYNAWARRNHFAAILKADKAQGGEIIKNLALFLESVERVIQSWGDKNGKSLTAEYYSIVGKNRKQGNMRIPEVIALSKRVLKAIIDDFVRYGGVLSQAQREQLSTIM